MLWKLVCVFALWLMIKGLPCLAKGNPGRPPFSNFVQRGYQYTPGSRISAPTSRWRPYGSSTTRWQPRPTVTATGPTCRFGRHFGCCYGWRRDNYGRCQPVCDKPCVYGTCVGHNQCQCKPGYRGSTCARDINECSSRPCQHRCMNTQGSYRCYCEEGYTLRSDKSTCMYDRRCESKRCSYGCQERGRYNVICICPEGLRVSRNGYSCQDINECVENPSICPIDKRCHNTYGSYTCLCKLGLSYQYVEGKYMCADEDECATRRHNCDRNALCTNKVRGYTCECRQGFAGNGAICVPTDQRTCNDDPCFPGVTCTDRPSGTNGPDSALPAGSGSTVRRFLCGPCLPGFIGDGISCQKLPTNVIGLTTITPTPAPKKIATTKAATTTAMLTTTTPSTAPPTTTVTTTAPPTTTVTTTAPPTTTVTTTAPPTTTVTTTAPPTTTVTTTAPPTTTVTTTNPPTTTVTTTAPPTTTVTTTNPPTTTVTTTEPPTTTQATTVTTSPPTTTVTTTRPPTTVTTTAPPTTTMATTVTTTSPMTTTVTTTAPPTTTATAPPRTLTTKSPPTTTKPSPVRPDWPQKEQPPASVSTTIRTKDTVTTKAPTTKRPTTTRQTTTATTTDPPTTTPPTTTEPPTTTKPTTVPTTTVITTTTVPPTTIPPPPSVTVMTFDGNAQRALLPDVGIRLMVPGENENATRLIENGTTGHDGMWKILIPEDTPVIITASRDGYLDTSHVYKFRPEEKNILSIEMTTPTEVEAWSWKSGYYKKLTFGDQQDVGKEYRVEIAPGALDVIEGAEVTMRFTPVDMADKDKLANLPEMVAAVRNPTTGGYDMEGLEVYSMVETQIYETVTHNPIDVLLPVIIEIPLPEDLTDARHGQQLQAWYFDAESGVWMQAGKGDVEYYRGGVMIWRYGARHFTWWAVGRTFPQTNCVVVYACSDALCTEPIPNIPVRLTGVDFFYAASKVTDEQGRTCFHFRRQGQVRIDSPCVERVKYSQGRGKPSMCPADLRGEIIQTRASNTIDSCASVRLVTHKKAKTTCDDPGTPEGAIVVGSDFSYGGLVTYYCGPSSYMVGAPRRACLECGQWGGENPTCHFLDSGGRTSYKYPSEKPFSNAKAATTTEATTRTHKPVGDQPKRRKKRRRRPSNRRPRKP